MEYRRLGRSGLKVSKLALGTMNFGKPTEKEASIRMIHTAIDAGINLLDCADAYVGGGSERILGEALAEDGKRKDVLITSKVFLPTGEGPNDRGNSRHHIMTACENSLKRLHTDRIDIYFLHRTDYSVPQEESLAALDLLVRQGKVRYIACSTHPPWRVVEAMWLAEKYHYPKFICEQPPYNLLDRRTETEIVPMCRDYDLGILAWSPLAQGILAGRYQDADRLPEASRGTQKDIFAERITPAGIQVAGELARRADAKGCTLPQLAVAWVLHQPGVTASIIGPRTEAHLEELRAAADIEMDSADLDFCDNLVKPGSFVSDHFNTSGWRSY